MAGKRIRAFTSIVSVLKQHPRVVTVSAFVQMRKVKLKDRREIFTRLSWKKAARLRFQHRVYLPAICVFFLIESYVLKKQNIIRKGKSPVSHLTLEDDFDSWLRECVERAWKGGEEKRCWKPAGSSFPQAMLWELLLQGHHDHMWNVDTFYPFLSFLFLKQRGPELTCRGLWLFWGWV